MPQYVIGVDLGASSVKAVVAERGFRSIEIQSFHEISVQDADRYPLQELIDQVRKPGASYAFRLAGDRVALRVLSLPFSDTKSIEQVIPGEVEAVLPFSLSEIVYDTHIGSRTAEGSRVVVAAARQTNVATFLKELSDAGADPRILDAEPLGLGALTQVDPQLKEGNVLIVDAGHRKTGVVALEAGSVTFGRTLARGASSLLRTLVDQGSLEPERARRVLESGVVEASEDPADALLYRAASGLAQEVARTITALEGAGSPRPDRILLVGGLSLVPGFPQLMERTCRLPVHELDLETTEAGMGDMSRAQVARAAAAIALAVRAGGDSKAVAINLRRESFAYHRDTRAVSGFIARAGMAVGILLLLAGVDFGVKSQMLRSERRSVQTRIASKVADVVPEADPKRLADDSDYAVSVLANEVKKLDAQVSTLSGTSVSGLDVLKEVSTRIPPEVTVDVTKFDFSNNTLRLDGMTDSFSSIDSIVNALKAEPAFFYEVEVVNRGSSEDRKTFKIVAKTTKGEE